MRIPKPPGFEWEGLRHFFAKRQVEGLESVGARHYSRNLPQGTLTVRFDSHISIDSPIHVDSRLNRLFDLDTDPGPILHHLRRDPFLARVLHGVTDLRLPGCWDPFEIAVRAIIGQQISVAAARTFLGRLVAQFGGFPDSAALAEADLSSIGLVRARANTLRLLSRALAEQQIGYRVDELRTIPGIGDWTAQYIALRALSHADAFPASDLVLRRVAAQGAAPLTERALSNRAEAWRPYRAYAVIAMWAYASRSTP